MCTPGRVSGRPGHNAGAALLAAGAPPSGLTSAHEADALRAVLARDGGVGGGVGVGEHADLAEGVHPLHEHRKRAAHLRRLDRLLAQQHLRGGRRVTGRQAREALSADRGPALPFLPCHIQQVGTGPNARASTPPPSCSGEGRLRTSPVEPLRESQSPSLRVAPARLAVLVA